MILCCGEALIDMIPEIGADGQTACVPHCGGAVFNTAIALGRLGARAGMFTGLSLDLFGRQLAEALKASHVDTSMVATSRRPTTLAFVQLEAGQATYTFYDENSAGRMVGPDDLPDLPKDVTALLFGGISLCNPPAADTYTALAERAAARCAIMLDPNIRPGFIGDIDAYRARLQRMMKVAALVKVSDEDLHWLMGEGEAGDLAARILALGPKLVCVTEGARGAAGYHAGGRVFVEARRVEVADTVGAGDTFNAGVLASLHRAGALTKARVAALSEAEIADALTLGVRAAAVTVGRAGANPPWDHELP